MRGFFFRSKLADGKGLREFDQILTYCPRYTVHEMLYSDRGSDPGFFSQKDKTE